MKMFCEIAVHLLTGFVLANSQLDCLRQFVQFTIIIYVTDSEKLLRGVDSLVYINTFLLPTIFSGSPAVAGEYTNQTA